MSAKTLSFPFRGHPKPQATLWAKKSLLSTWFGRPFLSHTCRLQLYSVSEAMLQKRILPMWFCQLTHSPCYTACALQLWNHRTDQGGPFLYHVELQACVLARSDRQTGPIPSTLSNLSYFSHAIKNDQRLTQRLTQQLFNSFQNISCIAFSNKK